jgi:hypothetical protein
MHHAKGVTLTVRRIWIFNPHTGIVIDKHDGYDEYKDGIPTGNIVVGWKIDSLGKLIYSYKEPTIPKLLSMHSRVVEIPRTGIVASTIIRDADIEYDSTKDK